MSDSATVVTPLSRTAHSSPAEDGNGVCDEQFMNDVEQLKALRSYMIRQAKKVEGGTIELGNLNLLRYSAKGRYPKYDEWCDLEHASNRLYQHLAEPDRRRFLLGQIPLVVVRTAGLLGIVAFGSLAAAVVFPLLPLGEVYLKLGVFVSFLFWAAALGAIGSIAFIGMNALAVQDDATFDLMNKKLIKLRVVLGALFGIVLTLPFGFEPFITFISKLFSSVEVPAGERALKSALLLLPFILGFSTSLVIMILNQFVEAVQSFFGKKSSPPPPPPAPAPVPVAPAQQP